ncbi:NAD(P)/FAD-dependent oxidoreductase [Nitratireductor kimnyeongensis]|uniref:Thioredoxin reductase n=1 Tax=Nitratireductor kimnyeongensis TaxID=430679 RepID=A0ABW0T7T5_9HYPH|nr:NAD(P)/FAD-dependent oxidoreductase [Nitratireductor kimnyeongensis]QZZ34214.1 NAD(P)/FAD-dependent oxidoreductase [Nitratireductor kimnyeongensis]
MDHDVIIIGGSYAGMAAALQLARARRKVLVIDAGERRNRTASHSHGFLSRDGDDPATIAMVARRQLEAYPTVSLITGNAVRAGGERDHFVVECADGAHHPGRRVILATGVRDHLPAIEGMAERWGKSIFHCPYCHGYELNQGRIGVIASGAMSTHQAELLTDWGDVTFLPNGVMALDPETQDRLEKRGIGIETAGIARIIGEADVQLADGRVLSFSGLFVAPRVEPSGNLASTLGCALQDTPLGTQIETNPSKETSIAGVFACGDAAVAPHSVSLAVADGAMAGAHVHRSLVWPGN